MALTDIQATSNGQYHPDTQANATVLDGRTLYKFFNTRSRVVLRNRGDNLQFMLVCLNDGTAEAEAWLYWTVDGEYDGVEAGRIPLTFGGNPSYTFASGTDYVWCDGIPLASQPAAGTVLWVCVQYKAITGTLVPQHRYLSKFDGEGWEAASSAGALPDRTAGGADIPLVDNTGGATTVCFRMYGPVDSRCDYSPGMIAFHSWGNSLNRGDNDGNLQRGFVAQALEDLGIAYTRSGVGATFGGNMADLGTDDVYDEIFQISTDFINQHLLNEIRTLVGGVAADHAEDVRDDFEANYAALTASYPDLYIQDMTCSPELYPESGTLTTMGRDTRLAYNTLLRTKTASGKYRGWHENALFCEDPADETRWRDDIGGWERQMDALHYTAFGQRFGANSLSPVLLGVTDEVSPLMAPPYTVLDPDVDGPIITFNVMYRDIPALSEIGEADKLSPAKGLTGITFQFSGGDANVIGGCVLPPTDPARLYVATAYAVLDRAIEDGETLTGIVVDPDTCNIRGKGDKVLVYRDAFQQFQTGDDTNDSTYSQPANGNVTTDVIDDDFTRANGAPGADYDADSTTTGNPATISGNTLSIPNGTSVQEVADVTNAPLKQTVRWIPSEGNPTIVFRRQAGGLYWKIKPQDIGAPNVIWSLYPTNDLSISRSSVVNMTESANLWELAVEELELDADDLLAGVVAKFSVLMTDLGNASGTGTPVVKINTTWNDNPGSNDASKPPAFDEGTPATLGESGIANEWGSTIVVRHYLLQRTDPDTTPPAWPVDAPDAGSGFVLRSGLEAFIPFPEELSVPLLPASGLAGFDDSIVESAQVVGDRGVLVTFNDADRITDEDTTLAVNYTAGAPGVTKLRDGVNNYAVSKSSLLLRNDSEFTADEPEPDDSTDSDPAGIRGLASLLTSGEPPLRRLFRGLRRL